MVLPCMGSLKHVTMCHVFRTTNTKAKNFSLNFFAPMHRIIVNHPSLLSGFKISQSFTRLLEASCHSLATTIKALKLGSSTWINYAYFVLIHIVIVVYTTWCWCLEGESLIYTMLNYLFHIVEYVVFNHLGLNLCTFL